MENRKHIETKHLLTILLLAYMFFFQGIGSYSLKEPDEGRYAEIPREMIELHDYVVPHLNYVRYFEKPPLFYWAVAASYKALGISEWSFRLPNALSALLCVVALYLGLRRWSGERAAFLSALILQSSFGFFAMARIVTIDMFFTLWTSLALLFFYGYYRERKTFFIYLFYLAMALATLAKGPVVLILMGATLIIYLFTERNIAFLKEMKILKGLLIYGILTVPWIVLISLKEKEFLYFFFIDQHVLRFLTTKHKRSGPLYYFIPVLLGGMFPWSLFLPRAVISLWSRKELRLFFIWSGVVFVFFSISSSKLPPYILPLFPSLSIIIASLFADKWEQFARRHHEIAVYALVFLVFATSAFIQGNSTFAPWLGAISPDARDIVNGLRAFSIAVSVVSLVLAGLFLYRGSARYSFVFPSLVIYSFFVVVILMLNSNTIDKLNTTKRLSTMINQEGSKVEYLFSYGSFEETLPFYTKRPVLVAAYKGELEMGSEYEDAKKFFLTEDEFVRSFDGRQGAYCVVRGSRLERLRERLHGGFTILGSQNGRYLISPK
jgi:4-amino-4-deoxy-L-arabinose transferase-like glycosyltransferase